MTRRTVEDWVAAASPLHHGATETKLIRDPKLESWAETDCKGKIWWHPDQEPRALLNHLLHEEMHNFTYHTGWYTRLGKSDEHLLVYDLAAWLAENYVRNPRYIELLQHLAKRRTK